VAEYYFDIETEGEDPRKHKIITAQFQRLWNGEPRGDFTILKEWEIGEKEIIRRIIDLSLLLDGFDFVPVGNRLKFELVFLIEKAQKYDMIDWGIEEIKQYFFKKPLIDIDSILILMNEGRFKGSSLDAFSGKKRRGIIVPQLYKEQKYDEIIEYIQEEKEAFLDLYNEVGSVLVSLGIKLRK